MGTGKQASQAASTPPRANEASGNRRDPAATVVYTMRQLAVAGLPRNYELFYEAITTSNKELSAAISALGSRPCQKDLDEIARKFLHRNDEWQVCEARDSIMDKLSEILSLLRKERSTMETYGKILCETSTGLETRPPLNREFLEKILNVTATATRSTIDSRSAITTTINDRSNELQEMKSTLEKYKRLAETDSLTQLYNRRAFDRTLTGIYDDARGELFGALILVDIDRFKSINDRFGHPVGDRIIQFVANIIRSSAGENAFVARTGGEEFALVVNGYNEDRTARLAEDIREAVHSAPFINFSTGANYGPVTVSLGLCMSSQAQGPDDLYRRADRALYASKAAGRNRVTRASHLEEGGLMKNWLLYRSD